MLVKNLIERLGVHDKTDHVLVSQVNLTRQNHRETSQNHIILRKCSNHVRSAQA